MISVKLQSRHKQQGYEVSQLWFYGKYIHNFKGLLHYPTCKAQLEVSAWSEVGRTPNLTQMTHLEVVWLG